MILYAKHLALMSFALFLVPVAGRFFARAAGRAHRVLRPGMGAGFALSRLLLALVVPVLAQGAFAWLQSAYDAPWCRFAALALAGAAYGGLFGDEEDFPRLAGALWGALGGLGAAWLYASIPASGEGRALCVALFAAVPLLAYRPFGAMARRRLSAGGLIVPHRRVLR